MSNTSNGNPPSKHQPEKRIHPLSSALLLIGLCGTTPLSQAQNQDQPAKESNLVIEEVIVTAQRREQNAQDVPISMTVMDQQQIDNANIIDASDLATYTPSLYSSNRFGTDSATYQIRGFTQELRTTSSVGVYFAEVVAPRGANTSSSGDGAGPGDFFDLANVQVLKGPQGTLFGRNTTGGAVLLTPQTPTDKLEGFVEVSGGNFDMRRYQGVLNVPVNDSLKLRVGFEDQQRDGYLENKSGIGPDELADVDYTAFRVSALWDINEHLQNYTIFKTLASDNSGSIQSLLACNTDASFGSFCAGDQANREALGANGFYDVWSNMESPRSEIDRKQIINTTTWEMNDKVTVKNILSYATFEFWLESDVFSMNWQFPTPGFGDSRQIIYAIAGLADGSKQADSSSFVEELQFQGLALDDHLTWQAGIYYEKTEPDGDYGSQSPALIACDRSTITDPNPANWRCNDLLAAAAAAQVSQGTQFTSGSLNPAFPVYVGSIMANPGGVDYENRAVYLQGTYDLNTQWSFTGGLRYTDDKTEGYIKETVAKFPGNIGGPTALGDDGYYAPDTVVTTTRNPVSDSDAVTWLLGVDYKPSENIMYYAKYVRGYRQGSVNLAAPDGYDTHEPEEVDSYEIGAKTQFDNFLTGTFNISMFYNDFRDQQIQYGYRRVDTGTGTTSIINAGESSIQGVELETTLVLTDSLRFNFAYTYLDTEVQDLITPEIPATVADPTTISVTTAEGESLPFVAENQVVANLSYQVPIDSSLGALSAGLTYVYNDEMQSSSRETSPIKIDAYELFNVNVNWNAVMGSHFDASLFVNNATDKEYYTYASGGWRQGAETGAVGLPRMYGLRLKYNF